MKGKEKTNIVKNNRGITLIALVVTIIILIILAGVSINLLFNEYGIVTRAQNSKQMQQEAQVKEDIQLKLADLQMEKLLKGTAITTSKLESIIEESGGEAVKDGDGNITGVKVGDIEIPIKEITGDIEIGDKEEIAKPGESGYLGSGYDDPYIPVGFNHTIGTWNSGYTIKDALNNEFVWVPCVTNVTKIKQGDNVELFKKTTEGKYNDLSLDLSPTDEEPTEKIRTSVGTYGGFYIAKYEAGVPVDVDGNEIAVTSAQTSQKARSVSGATVWTNISRASAITAAENMIDSSIAGVNSGLISGEAWDTTLQWMVNTSDNASSNTGYDINSSGKGWYNNGDKTTTGYYPVNNIYDMAGNVWEWTTENCTYNGFRYLVIRGGYNLNSGSYYPSASRECEIDGASTYNAFRVVLYK